MSKESTECAIKLTSTVYLICIVLVVLDKRLPLFCQEAQSYVSLKDGELPEFCFGSPCTRRCCCGGWQWPAAHRGCRCARGKGRTPQTVAPEGTGQHRGRFGSPAPFPQSGDHRPCAHQVKGTSGKLRCHSNLMYPGVNALGKTKQFIIEFLKWLHHPTNTSVQIYSQKPW